MYYSKLGGYGLASGETTSFLALFSGSFLIRPIAALFPIEIFGMAAAKLSPTLTERDHPTALGDWACLLPLQIWWFLGGYLGILGDLIKVTEGYPKTFFLSPQHLSSINFY